MTIYKYVKQNELDMILNRVHEVEEEDCIAVKKAYNICLKLLWIEEKFNILVENYLEFEEDIYLLYVDLSKIKNNDREKLMVGQKGIINLNRRVANFLGSVRMYIDQVQHDLSTVSKETNIMNLKEQFHKESQIQYDSSVGYQMMEFLRNQIQHAGLIIESLYAILPLFPTELSLKVTPIFVEINYTKVKRLEKFEQKIIGKSFLNDMKLSEISIVPMIREYIKGLEKIHYKFREITEDVLLGNLQTVITKACMEDDETNGYGKVAFIKAKIDNTYVDGVLVQKEYLSDVQITRKKDLIINKDTYFINEKAYYHHSKLSVSNTENFKIRYNMSSL
jgi:hypothetical protein